MQLVSKLGSKLAALVFAEAVNLLKFRRVAVFGEGFCLVQILANAQNFLGGRVGPVLHHHFGVKARTLRLNCLSELPPVALRAQLMLDAVAKLLSDLEFAPAAFTSLVPGGARPLELLLAAVFSHASPPPFRFV